MKPKAFLFDIGNVLVSFDFTLVAQRLAAESDAATEDVLKRLLPFKDELESGRMSDDDFVDRSMAHIRFRGTREDFIRIWGDIFTDNAPMTALVRELAEWHPLYLLSNTSGLHKTWLFENFPVFSVFQGGVYSHEARCMKPHDAIFQQAIAELGLNPEQTIYIDDLHDNIVTGRRLGFISHQYRLTHHHEMQEFLTSIVPR